MAEKYELDRWAAVVCNGFTAVNVMSSGNVEELGWDYTEMELDPTGTCGLFDGMLLDWDDDTPAERRDHEAYFPDAFTVGARILADDWDHELGNDEVRSRCFAIIEDADQFTDHDTARDWLCESTMADFSEVEARTFFQNLTLMDSEEIAKLDGRPIIPSAGADECRAAVLAFNERMVPRRRELGLGDTAVVGKTKKSEATSKVVPMKSCISTTPMRRNRRRGSSCLPTGHRVRWYASTPARRSSRHSRRAARSASPPGPCAHRPARASNATGSTSITATSRNRARSSSGNDIRRPGPSSAWKPARPSTATRPPRAPCTYRPRPSARPFATERPSPGSISTMETNRSRLRSYSSLSSPNAV